MEDYFYLKIADVEKVCIDSICYFRDDLHRCCIVNGCHDILFIHIYLDGWVKHLGIDKAY